MKKAPALELSEEHNSDLIDYYCLVGRRHEIFYLWRPTLRDPEDEMLLELAVKAQCDFLVTFNVRDFQGSERFGIKIVTPGEFLEQIGER